MSSQFQYITIQKGDPTPVVPSFRTMDFWGGLHKQPNATVSHKLWGAIPVAVQLVQDTLGADVDINSTVRFPGGSHYGGGNSQHDYQNARAVDIGLPASKTAQVYKDIMGRGPLFQALFALGARGFGIYDTFMHVDFRTSGGLQQYNGTPYAFWDERETNKPALDLVASLVTPMPQPNEDDRTEAQRLRQRILGGLIWLIFPTVLIITVVGLRKLYAHTSRKAA